MMGTSVTGLLEKRSGELVWVSGIDRGWVPSEHRIQAGKGFGVVARIELSLHGRGKSFESFLENSSNLV
jgi:hypothetical protein